MGNRHSNNCYKYSRFENDVKNDENTYGYYWKQVKDGNNNKWTTNFNEKTNFEDEKKPLLGKIKKK